MARVYKKGKDSKVFRDRTGEVYISNEGYKMTIIACRGATDCDVQFDDKNKTVVLNKSYQHISLGGISNPYHPTTQSRGYMGQGKHKSRTKAHFAWNNMFKMCYDTRQHLKYPNYIGCEVCEEWMNFQVFAEWYETNYKEDWYFTKGIILKRNKIYSPETCCFVPSRLNGVFTKCDKSRGECVIGVSKNKNGKFKSSLNKSKSYLTELEAFEAYKIAKETLVKGLANEFKDELPSNAYWALMNYKVEIED